MGYSFGMPSVIPLYHQAPVHLSCLGLWYQGTRSDFIPATGTPKGECEFNCSIVVFKLSPCSECSEYSFGNFPGV